MTDAPPFSGARAMEEVAAFVALGPRDAGTPGLARAADYVRDRLESFGVTAHLDLFQDDTPEGETTFRNVTGVLPGTGPGLIILLSHMDTKRGIAPDFAGANDSGSSTGLLLELARVLNDARRGLGGPEIWFAFVDGEECMRAYGPRDGLHGSRRMAAQLKAAGRARDVRAVLVLDMIGDRDLTVTLPRNGDRDLTRAVLAAAEAEGVREHFRLARGGILDDHVPFLEAGMPAVAIIDFEYGSRPGANDYWHTPEDTLDKLSPRSLEIVGRVVLRLLQDLPRGGQASSAASAGLGGGGGGG